MPTGVADPRLHPEGGEGSRLIDQTARRMQMQNNNPKSEKPAMKERAAEAKDKSARQQSTAREQMSKSHGGVAQRRADRLKSGDPTRK